MAKKEKEEKKEPTFIDILNKKLESTVIKSAKDFKALPKKIISISPAHDLGLGGLPQGSWITIAGKPKTHKTTTCIHITKKCQEQGMDVYWGNVEARLKERDLKLNGIDEDRFFVIESTPEKLMTAVDYLNTFENILKNTNNSVLVIDSASMLADEKEIEGGIGTSTRGGGAKYLSQFCRNMAGVVTSRGHIVISILQLMANTSGYGSPFQEKGGNSIVYQADIRLMAKESKLDTVDDKVVGATIKWQSLASATSVPPGQEYYSVVRYGKGIDEIAEIASMAESLGIIEKGGAWYKFKIGEEDIKLQGIESVRAYLNENNQAKEQIHAEIKELLRGG